MNKSILIFGAGINQLTLIEAANELSITSVAIDPNPKAPGKKLADYFYCIPDDDYEGTKNIAKKHNVDGIVTGQTEKPLKLMAKLAQDMGYIFNSSEVLERSLDKWKMKKTFLENDIPCAIGKILKKDEVVNSSKSKELSFPLIMKPRNATSSQGVFKVKSISEIKKFREISESYSKNNEIIVEEFLEGPEYSVESVTYNGSTHIVQYTEKFITPFPYTVEMGHIQPANLTAVQQKEIDKVVKQAINAIGIDNSAAHTEVKLTKEGPKIVEIGPRLGGDFISSYLTLHSTGVNMDKAAVQVALGLKPDISSTLKQFSYIKYFQLPSGKIVKKIEDWKSIQENENVVFAYIDINDDEMVPKITHSGQRPGFVIVKGKTREEVIETAKYFENKLKQKIILI